MSGYEGSELVKVVVLLATSVTIVPLFKRIGLGNVLGYLVAGCLIGPSVFGLFKDPSSIVHTAELGVVMFLFIIGLEMRPERLWAMRKAIFGRGLLQVGLCGTLLTFAGIYLLGLPKEVAFIAGMGFSLSSTAIVMQVLADRGTSATPKGQRVISTLLFEDLAIVPLLASIAFLAPSQSIDHSPNWTAIGVALIAIVGLIVAGKWLMNPLFRMISKAHIREMMTAAALLVVLGAALAMELGGLSMAMGAFVAGVMLSESAFRHQLEADIEPFRGLLLGLFFMGVGMSLDLSLVWHNFFWLLGIVLIYVIGKAIAVYVVAKMTLLDNQEATGRMAIMAHGGEFAFVLFSAATSAQVLSKELNATFTAAVIISMLLSPLILLALRKFSKPASKAENTPNTEGVETMDLMNSLENTVVVIGFGRFNQVVCQTLLARGLQVSVIDINLDSIRAAANFGFKVYYGDGSRVDVLRACGLEKACCVIVGIGREDKSLQIVEQIKQEYPLLPVLARTYDRQSAVNLVKANVDYQIRETFESALALAKRALIKSGVAEMEAADVVNYVRTLDQERFNQEVLHGFSTELTRKYWTPKPFIQPTQTPEALNEEAINIVAAVNIEPVQNELGNEQPVTVVTAPKSQVEVDEAIEKVENPEANIEPISTFETKEDGGNQREKG